MGVGVDEAGQQQHTRHINDLRIGRDDVAAHLHDLLAVNEHIGALGAPAGHHRAAFEQSHHNKKPPFRGRLRLILQYSTKTEKSYSKIARNDGFITKYTKKLKEFLYKRNKKMFSKR